MRTWKESGRQKSEIAPIDEKEILRETKADPGDPSLAKARITKSFCNLPS
jgi:hypothetical protein